MNVAKYDRAFPLTEVRVIRRRDQEVGVVHPRHRPARMRRGKLRRDAGRQIGSVNLHDPLTNVYRQQLLPLRSKRCSHLLNGRPEWIFFSVG